MLKNSKSYLEFIRNDATLLGVAIMVLFVENSFHYTYGRSLISDTQIEFEQVLQFKFLFGFIIFIFACKALFTFVWIVLDKLLPLYKLDTKTSYRVGFGCFAISILLFFHAWISDDTNLFLSALNDGAYKTICILLGLFALLLASLCDWSGNETQVNSK